MGDNLLHPRGKPRHRMQLPRPSMAVRIPSSSMADLPGEGVGEGREK